MFSPLFKKQNPWTKASRKKQTAERSESWRRLQPGNSKSNDDCEVIVVKSTQNVKIKS